MRDLEEKIDREFNENPLLNLPFCALYDLLCQAATGYFLENRQIASEILTPFCYILKRDLDFSPISPMESLNIISKIEGEDLTRLISHANLNIAFPFIHSKIYSLTKITESESLIDYESKEAEFFEGRDVVLTNLSLPRIAPFKVQREAFYRLISNRIKKEKPIQIAKCKSHILEIYTSISRAFIEEPLVSNDFYTSIGFSGLDAFTKIRHAFCAFSQAYVDATYLINKYIQHNQIDSQEEINKLWAGFAMARLSNVELRDLILEICGCRVSDYEKFQEFFFAESTTNHNIDNKFLPPFWKINEFIYFMPCAVPTLLSTRNLLISIQNDPRKKAQYRYDEYISGLFEPTLLGRAERYFRENGFCTALERAFDGGEIDMLAYCRESHTILSIQAKATLFPESARMVRRLDTRIIEGVEQTKKFDKLDESKKNAIFEACFDLTHNPAKVTHIRGILTNSGFGSHKSWKEIELQNIVPLNCNILRNTLPSCKKISDLPMAVNNYIEKVVNIAKPTLRDKIFKMEDHTIHQKNIDIDGMEELYKMNLMGG